MRDLIGDLLDAGRIEAGTLSVAPEPSEVADLVDRARNTFLSGGGRHTGQGARFTFTLPVAEQTRNVEPPAVSGPHSPHASPETRNPIRILVVDDDPQTLRYVRDALAASGYAPLVTGGHENLSHIIRTEQPQLVLLDLMLPGTDGIELMKSVPELGDLPVVFISGYGRDETIARALESGAADYIVKPFSATELTACPASRTGSRRASSPTSRPTPPARRSSATCSPPASACRASTGRSGQRVRSTARRRSTARAGGPHLPGAARRRGGLRSRSARSCR